MAKANIDNLDLRDLVEGVIDKVRLYPTLGDFGHVAVKPITNTQAVVYFVLNKQPNPAITFREEYNKLIHSIDGNIIPIFDYINYTSEMGNLGFIRIIG